MDTTMIPHYKSWSEVPKNLVSKTTIRNQKLKPGAIRATVYQRANCCNIDLYDISEAVPRRAPTEKQLQAIERARAAMIALRTCSRCGIVLNQRLDGLCYHCETEQWLEGVSAEAQAAMSEWVNHKDRYVVLDTETTGLDDAAEIIELSIIDLDENILFNSLIKPEYSVTAEVTGVHGISDDMLSGAPAWPAVWPKIKRIIRGKTLLIYNDQFDIRLIKQSCKRHRIIYRKFSSHCVMETYAQYIKSYSFYHISFTWVKLSEAAEIEGI